MKVSDILRIKGHTLYTAEPAQPLLDAVRVMSDKDIGSLVVMDHGKLVGMLTFREVIQVLVAANGSLGPALVGAAVVDGADFTAEFGQGDGLPADGAYRHLALVE